MQTLVRLFWPLYMLIYCMFKCAFVYLYIFWIGESEEFDSTEAMRKFKKSKQKKTIVSVFAVVFDLYLGRWH